VRPPANESDQRPTTETNDPDQQPTTKTNNQQPTTND
jgi:hypothetical protein